MIATTESGRSTRRSSKAATCARVERRQRSRLRELCDEVLASYRVANGRDLFTEADRAEARSFLMQLGSVAR